MNINKICNKYKYIIFYLFFGICTTAVNVAVYWGAAHLLSLGTMPSTMIAWVSAVSFAYLTNRKWVFYSNASGWREVSAEITSFFTCRLVTGGVDWICMFVLVDVIGLNDVVIKFLANVIVTVLNFAASKLVIFRAGRKTDKKIENEAVSERRGA